MKPKIYSLLLLPFIILASCSPASLDNQVSQPKIDTPPFPLPTNTEMVTAVPSNESYTVENCIVLKSVDFDGAVFEGLLLVGASFTDRHIFDPTTNQFLDINKAGVQIFTPIYLSPNKKNILAFNENYEYVVRSLDKLVKKAPSGSIGWLNPRWLDNEHITYLTPMNPYQEVVIWNPFTDEQQIIRFEVPNPKIEHAGNVGMFILSTYIDTKLKRAFYVDQEGRLILWDIEKQTEVSSLPAPAEGTITTRGWSPDGTKYVTSWPEGSAQNPLANELYVFDMNGGLEQWTSLNQKYGYANLESPSWSPGGHHIAFWLRIGEGNKDPETFRQWLSVLDTDTLKTERYCLADRSQPWQALPAIWSPDGKQLIVNFGSQRDHTHQTILVDLEHQTQSVIDTKSMEVWDWMAP